MSFPLVRLSFLDLIRGFVAVGRRMSITVASRDLCLTQSAVSRQINALEEQLGVKLFVRGFRSIAFTPEGERLFRSADSAIRDLQQALGEVQRAKGARPVTISASIGVTGLWLLPRLSRFQAQYPALELRISANNRISDLYDEGIDLAIRYTTASAAPKDAIRLFGESVAPVGSPSTTGKIEPGKMNLSDLNLLEFDDPQHPLLQWSGWLSAAGLTETASKNILHFNQYDQVIHAAVAGQGVALGRLPLIQPMLNDGKLARLSDEGLKVNTDYGYYLLFAECTSHADVERVASWICEESKACEF